ncbi:hydrolase [bacterium]|nr:hydrolase [bacterium]
MIDRTEFALVIVDVQERLAAAMDDRDRVIAAISRLARMCALVSAPMLLTRQYPKGLGPTVPELEALVLDIAREGARVSGVDKTAFCCVAEHDFVEALSATGRHQIVVGGMETHICVTQTALALLGQGYRVQVPADACCSRADSDHAIALDRLRAAGVVITTSESVMYEAVGSAGTDEFKRLLEIVKG